MSDFVEWYNEAIKSGVVINPRSAFAAGMKANEAKLKIATVALGNVSSTVTHWENCDCIICEALKVLGDL